MLPTRVLRNIAPEIPYIYTNTYKAKRLWPPDFSKIDRKHQFRLERKYKRRAKLKWARPRWTKAVKLAQMGSVTFIAIYGALFLDWNNEGNPEHRPFSGLRTWFFGLSDSIFSRERVQKGTGDAVPTSKSAS